MPAAVFAQELRRLRESRSLTQEELAERSGVTAKAIGALERGERKRPYPHTVRSLADALDLTGAERAALLAAVPGRAESPTPRSGVPAPAGPVLGREDDAERVAALVVDGVRRVVTLTGPGGVGKTTLATEVARRVASSFPGGTVFVALEAVTDPVAVLPGVAAALGVPEAAGPTTVADLAPYLQDRRLLLVLDNLEQVTACAGELAALVRWCPELAVLATSRVPLRVREEQEVRVAPLDGDAAVELLVDRVRAAGGEPDGDDAALAAVVARLDGLPLAIELVAPAAATLGPRVLAERWRDVLVAADGPRDLPDRQRTMTATLDWSHDLLGEAERELLARLAVLTGSFDLALAEAVDGGADAVRRLTSLVESSWVVRSPGVRGVARYRLLEPVREHLADRGRADLVAETARRRTDHVLRAVRSLAEDLEGAGLDAALDLLEADVAHLRAARSDLLATGRAAAAAGLLRDVWLFLALRGHAREGLAWAEDLRGRPLPDADRAGWLTGAAGLAYVVGDNAAQRRDAEEALVLAEAGSLTRAAAEAALLAGTGALFTGDLAGAVALLARARRHVTGSGSGWADVHVTTAEGQVALLAGRFEEADRLLGASVERARALGNSFALATALNVRATLTELGDRHEESVRLLTEAAELSVAGGLGWTLAYTLPALAGVAVRLGEHATGARLFGASASYADRHTVATGFQATQQLAGRDLATAREGLGEQAFREAWEEGRDATTIDVVALAHRLSRGARG